MTADLAKLRTKGGARGGMCLKAQQRDLAGHGLRVVCAPGYCHLGEKRKEIVTGSEWGVRATEPSRSCEKRPRKGL